MPLSELFGLAAGNLESSQKKPCPSEFFSREENDLVELVWEDGQIKLHSQSNRAATRSSALGGLPSSTNRARDAGSGHASGTRVGKFCGVHSILDDLSPVVPLGELNLSQDDDMAPWLGSYPMGDNDTLPEDYGSEFLTGMSGVTANGMSAQHSFASVGKRSACQQIVENLQNGGNVLKASSSMAPTLSSWPSQPCQASDAFGSGISDINSGNNVSNHPVAVVGNGTRGRDMVNDSPSVKTEMQKNNGVPMVSLTVPNFSLFSRPAALVKAKIPSDEAKIPSSDGILTSASPTVERMEVKEMGSSACANNLVESTRMDQSKDMPKDINFHASSAKFASVNSRQMVQAPKEACPSGRIENFSRVASCKKDEFPTSGDPSNSAKVVPKEQRIAERMADSSSVCSGNGAKRVSGDKAHYSKRKFCDIDDSEWPCSDDCETESTGIAKPIPARGSGPKRSRAAEVHNLSERRRRDRINEKMRALQELIPNCSKVDKASMLDEAIEYLKTLQLQVQIMSMGAGLCMPPVMFPTGMQHIRPAQIPHFPPVGVGMGMGIGIGYGMSMPDMNGRTPGCPIFPVHPMQAGRYPSPMSGMNNFQRVPAPIHPLYGHLNQAGIHNSVPGAPMVPLAGQHPINSAMGLAGFRNGSQNEAPGASPNFSCGDTVKNKNSDLAFNARASSSTKDECTQPNTMNEALDQSPAVQENDHTFDARKPASAAHASTNAGNIIKEAGSG